MNVVLISWNLLDNFVSNYVPCSLQVSNMNGLLKLTNISSMLKL